MAITPTDESNLLLPLFEGIFEQPLWETFLRRLAQRTGAQRVRLTVINSAAPEQMPLRRRVLADRLAQRNDPGEPDPIDARVYAALRPNRVYAINELREFDPNAASVGDARLIRVAGRGDLNAWIVLLHEREAFSAADSALLTALAPAVATALSIFATLGGMRLRLEAAEGTLALLGIEQEILDRSGKVLGEEARAGNFVPGQTPMLAEACLTLANADPAERRLVAADGRDFLLRPTGKSRADLPHPAAAVAMLRTKRREPAESGSLVLARQYGLSPREAALTEAISRGVPLIEAGRSLRLTPETTRNYSKRIYAKTGTSGQADLVRLLLEGLAPLA